MQNLRQGDVNLVGFLPCAVITAISSKNWAFHGFGPFSATRTPSWFRRCFLFTPVCPEVLFDIKALFNALTTAVQYRRFPTLLFSLFPRTLQSRKLT
jgi:hypothetical protein